MRYEFVQPSHFYSTTREFKLSEFNGILRPWYIYLNIFSMGNNPMVGATVAVAVAVAQALGC